MIILIIRRNMSASGLIATPKEGQRYPTAMPTSRPMKICVVTLGTRERFAAEGDGGGAE